MPGGANPLYVLDTSALLCLIEAEEGMADVEKIIRHHGPGGRVSVSFISMMEFFYINHIERGESVARQRFTLLKELPLVVVESDEELCLIAGHIKASHRLSVADAWVAATAHRLGAILVHKDPEFEPLAGDLLLHPLPYK